MLGAWAEQTERIEFGTLVSCNSYRNADLQADMARTLDHISAKGDGPGRFIFGTGAGWFQQRLRRVRLRVRHPGHPPATRSPTRCRASRPAGRSSTRRRRAEIPVMIGGKGEQKTLQIVAKHADIWHSFVVARRPAAQARRARAMGRRGRPRRLADHGVERAHPAPASTSSTRTRSTTPACACSRSASAGPTTTSRPCGSGSPGATRRTASPRHAARPLSIPIWSEPSGCQVASTESRPLAGRSRRVAGLRSGNRPPSVHVPVAVGSAGT